MTASEEYLAALAELSPRFFFSSRRRHTRFSRDWSSDVCSSDLAVIGLTRGLARDLGPFKIRLNAITPGWIMTQRQIDLWLTPEAEAGLMQAQCLKEKLYPPDIARMALWLAADDSRLVTAQNFVVDGGRM